MFYNDPRIGMVQGDLHKADDEDGSWITMNGTHVHMKDGEVDKGPQSVKDHVSAKNSSKEKTITLQIPARTQTSRSTGKVFKFPAQTRTYTKDKDANWKDRYGHGVHESDVRSDVRQASNAKEIQAEHFPMDNRVGSRDDVGGYRNGQYDSRYGGYARR
jgi:hypothetical protein